MAGQNTNAPVINASTTAAVSVSVTTTTTIIAAMSKTVTATSVTTTVSTKTLENSNSSSTTPSDTIPVSHELPIDLAKPLYDCQYVFAAWEKFGRTTQLNKTDPEACCSVHMDSNKMKIIDQSKAAQIGKVRCSGFQVVEM